MKPEHIILWVALGITVLALLVVQLNYVSSRDYERNEYESLKRDKWLADLAERNKPARLYSL